MKRIVGTVCLLGIGAFTAAAQDPVELKKMADEQQAKTQMEKALQKFTVLSVQGGLMSNIPDAPYSAEQITENTQTLGDGTRIHNENAVKVYRDGKGRIRRETPEMISIFDPVAGVGYNLNPQTLTGSKMQISVSLNRSSYSFSSASSGEPHSIQVYSGTMTANDKAAAARAGSGMGSGGGVGVGVNGGVSGAITAGVPGGVEGGRTFFYSLSGGPNMAFTKMETKGKTENLGTQSMEGLTVQGERHTNTIDANEIGNDRPIQTVDEHWYSPDLQLDVKTIHSDPRTGEQTTQLVNVRRGEPDASLFQVPAAYQIDEGAIRRKTLQFPPKDQ